MMKRLLRPALLAVLALIILSAAIGTSGALAATNERPTVNMLGDDTLKLGGNSTYALFRNIQRPKDFTAEIWARSTDPVWNDNSVLITYRHSDNDFMIHPDKGTRTVAVYIKHNGSLVRVAQYTPDDITEWHHYAITYKFAFNGPLLFYVDGKQVASYAGFSWGYDSNSLANLLLGADDGRYGKVELDEFRLWNRVRTPSEIKAGMTQQMNGNESSLLLHAGMDAWEPGFISGSSYQKGSREYSLPVALEDQAPFMLPAIGFADSDAVTDQYTVSLSASLGQLTALETAGLQLAAGAQGSSSISWTGGSAALHRMLASLQYDSLTDVSGNDQLVVHVTDSGSAAAAEPATGVYTLPIRIEPVNDAPRFSPGPNMQATEGSGIQTYEGWAAPLSAGPDNERQTLSLNVSTDSPELFVQAPALDEQGKLTFQPKEDVEGEANVTVTLKDDGGTANGGADTTVKTFKITVLQSNLRPFVSPGKGIALDGSNDYVQSPSIQINLSYAAEIWARSHTPLWASSAPLVYASGQNGFQLIPTEGTNKLSVQFMDGWGGLIFEDVFEPENPDRWHHYAFSLQDNRGETTASFYLDGTLVGTRTEYIERPRSSNASFYLGTNPSKSSFAATDIDEFRFWRAPRSQEQISSQFMRPLRSGDAKPQVYYPLNEALNGTTRDESGSRLNGSVFGAPGSARAFLQGGGGLLPPAVQTTPEDRTLSMIVDSVGDFDGEDLTLTLSVSHGQAELAHAEGLTLEDELPGSGGKVYRGSQEALQAGLRGLVYTPALNFNGTDELRISVSDGGNNGQGRPKTAERSYSIAVVPVNDAPSFEAGENIQEEAGNQLRTYPGWAASILPGPSDEAAQQVSFAAAADRPELFALQPSVSADGTLQFAFADDAAGSSTVRVRLKDDGGTEHGGANESEERQFVISVLPAPSPEPTSTPSPEPSSTPSPQPSSSPSPQPSSTPSPEPTSTPSPEPSSTPSPTPTSSSSPTPTSSSSPQPTSTPSPEPSSSPSPQPSSAPSPEPSSTPSPQPSSAPSPEPSSTPSPPPSRAPIWKFEAAVGKNTLWSLHGVASFAVAPKSFNKDSSVTVAKIAKEELPATEGLILAGHAIRWSVPADTDILSPIMIQLPTLQQPFGLYQYSERLRRWVALEKAPSGESFSPGEGIIAAFQETARSYKDLSGHWAEPQSLRLNRMGIMQGMPDGTFQPDKPITRAELAVMLARMLNLAVSQDQPVSFADSNEIPAWARETATIMLQTGLLKGIPASDGIRFEAERPMTRAEAAVMAKRVLELFGETADFTNRQVAAGFTDSSLIPEWARSSIEEISEHGILNGYSDGSFKSGSKMTRGEAAVLFSRLLDYSLHS
ncbi:S-layer homology domain-containing protein [Paenibacillus pasadenensis]|uniref:LamG-like jellyroll fold domain-containing protein n=1 Tax=Paenibacillus pasadenensis TaxID=217090 RepID=UPI002041031A|nr:LamG-like jellyroll fold domain-containing protein [Paenibacillus pasadenensis]MCM3749214.1 S-layer homology domain-containing protein [Paenibacillus pasadenensis]